MTSGGGIKTSLHPSSTGVTDFIDDAVMQTQCQKVAEAFNNLSMQNAFLLNMCGADVLKISSKYGFFFC
jgi:hypothetical protein